MLHDRRAPPGEARRRRGALLPLSFAVLGCSGAPSSSDGETATDGGTSDASSATTSSGETTGETTGATTRATDTAGTSASTATTSATASTTAESESDTTDTGAIGEWHFVTLDTQSFPLNGAEVEVEFIRAERPDGGRSYLLYQHGPAPASPLVIQTEPYAGIDWTGEAIDEAWARKGSGAFPDVDAPAYNGVDMIAYTLQDPAEAVGTNNVWAFNGFAAIHTYGRFYAGGALDDDTLDAVAPYMFARTRPDELDLSRIGAFGSSWGGMMALFGASEAPADAAPRIVVPISAPSDFADLWTWSHDTFPAAS
ncbi:MAG: hypothetical protein R3B09_09185, partial [Nannocystaceae bacterium]